MVPWKILNSAQTFLAFMGGHAVFLAPIAGILASDCWLVHEQHIDVPALYNPHGRYHYTKGVNWRALAGMVVSVTPNLPGLAKSFQATTVISAGAQNLYTFDWWFGFVTSVVVYTALSYAAPHPESRLESTIYGNAIVEANGSNSDVQNKTIEQKVDAKKIDMVTKGLKEIP